MGVSTNVYTMHGTKIDWDDKFIEAYDEVYDDKDTPIVLLDGMGGDYIVFGTTLFDSGVMRWGLEGGDTFKEFELEQLHELETTYKTEFKTKFPEFAHLMDVPFKIMSFVHYS